SLKASIVMRNSCALSSLQDTHRRAKTSRGITMRLSAFSFIVDPTLATALAAASPSGQGPPTAAPQARALRPRSRGHHAATMRRTALRRISTQREYPARYFQRKPANCIENRIAAVPLPVLAVLPLDSRHEFLQRPREPEPGLAVHPELVLYRRGRWGRQRNRGKVLHPRHEPDRELHHPRGRKAKVCGKAPQIAPELPGAREPLAMNGDGDSSPPTPFRIGRCVKAWSKPRCANHGAAHSSTRIRSAGFLAAPSITMSGAASGLGESIFCSAKPPAFTSKMSRCRSSPRAQSGSGRESRTAPMRVVCPITNTSAPAKPCATW